MSRLLPTLCTCVGLLSACAATTPNGDVQVLSTTLKAAPPLEGTVKVPSKLLSDATVAAAKSLKLLAVGEELPLTDAPVTLLDPSDNFYKNGSKTISATTNRQGEYRFLSPVPRSLPVIVSAALSGNRRLLGFTVQGETAQKLDLNVASTYVTEFLRLQAASAGKSMGDYDLAQLLALTQATRGMLDSDKLPLPDLLITQADERARQYALTVGTQQALGDDWETLLGKRVIASRTVAGDGHAGPDGDGGPALTAGFYRPRQVVADANGHLFIADEGNHRIRRIDAKTGVITTYAGAGRPGFGGDGKQASLALLNAPRTLAVDAQGNLYIGDQQNARIRKVDAATGLIETLVGAPASDGAGGWLGGREGDGGPAALARIFAPRGLAVDADGDLYIADSARGTHFHVIRKVDSQTGVITTVVGTPDTPGAFSGDNGPATSARLNFPNQLALDPQGRLLMADTDNHVIRRVDLSSGAITTVAGIGGQKGDDADGKSATKTRLNFPTGIAVAADGRLYISESGSERLRTVGGDGLMVTLAGGGSDPRDGDALRLKLAQPQDLFVEATGNLLVADTRAERIRRVFTRFGL